MTSVERVFNFCAGPAAIPLAVLEQARDEMLSFRGSGMSVMEISHRSPLADAVFEEVEENLRQLMKIPDNYRVLFLQGGGQMQFSMVPMNFLREDAMADYVLTGHWGEKAIGQGQLEGRTHVAWTGAEDGYIRVPGDHELRLMDDAAYTYFTSNETIQGVQFAQEPASPSPLICDASSDFLSAPVDIERYGFLYACAQKNAGPSGLTIVIVSDEMLERVKPGLHKMLDYRRHADAGSRLNTPPTFSIYLFLLVSRWLQQDIGGLEAMKQRNGKQAKLLYDALDRYSDFYATHAEPASRSKMNVTFRCLAAEPETAAALDAEFLIKAEKNKLMQLKGHRSVGGMRASIYNAMPMEGVEALVEFLEQFRAQHR